MVSLVLDGPQKLKWKYSEIWKIIRICSKLLSMKLCDESWLEISHFQNCDLKFVVGFLKGIC